MPLCSFANFKLVMSCQKEWRGALGHGLFGLCVNPSLVSAIPTAYLLCSTAIQRDIRAAWCFCICKLPCRNVECVLLHCFDEQLYVFVVVKCFDTALIGFYSLFQRVAGDFCCYELLCLGVSVVFCYGLLTCTDNLYWLHWHIVQQWERRVRLKFYACCVNKLRHSVGLQTWIWLHIVTSPTTYYPVTTTTIRHCLTVEFERGEYNQAVALDITRPLHATEWHPCHIVRIFQRSS